MLLVLSLLVCHADCQVTYGDRLLQAALWVATRSGWDSERIASVLGPPDHQIQGRIDWRQNPKPYLLWQYDRYNVWIEWDGVGLPVVGNGRRVMFSGGVDP